MPGLFSGNMGGSNGSSGGGYSPYATGGMMAGMGLGSMLSSWQNPADAAMSSLNQIPDTMKQYYQPYIDAGNKALPQMQSQFGQLAQDPGGRLNQIGQSFHQSPGFDFALKQALRASNNGAAAGGMFGTPQNQQENMEYATGLANQNYNDWMHNAMGLYGTGLEGLGDISHMGFQGSNELAQSIANSMMQKSSLQYQGANAQNMHDQGGLGSLMGGLGTIGSLLAFA